MATSKLVRPRAIGPAVIVIGLFIGALTACDSERDVPSTGSGPGAAAGANGNGTNGSGVNGSDPGGGAATGGGNAIRDPLNPPPLPQTLTGTVRRSGTCILLVVGSKPWALVGEDVGKLHAGKKVTVDGQLTQMPGECTTEQVGQALRVTKIRSAG